MPFTMNSRKQTGQLIFHIFGPTAFSKTNIQKASTLGIGSLKKISLSNQTEYFVQSDKRSFDGEDSKTVDSEIISGSERETKTKI
ncbi:hypothetical protein QQG55_41575 [Brugia pahangi]